MKRQTIYAGRLERVSLGDTVDGINEGEPATVSDQLTTRDAATLREVFILGIARAEYLAAPHWVARCKALAKRLGVEVE